MIRIVGDVHGSLVEYQQIIHGVERSIQLGDMGCGFLEIPELDINHRWFCGNHDNRDLAQKHLNHMGDWGYLCTEDIFYVSGASSIDRAYRVPGVSWWANEELTDAQFWEIYNKYKEIRPNIVITHASPESIKWEVLSNPIKMTSRTEQYLDSLLTAHRPKIWIFGHLHQSFDLTIDGTRFICLDILQYFDLNPEDYAQQNGLSKD